MVLLGFLRIIIDKFPNLLLLNLKDLKSETSINLVIDTLVKSENDIIDFDLNDNMSITFYDDDENEENVNRRPDEVDIWTFKRVMDTIKQLY